MLLLEPCSYLLFWQQQDWESDQLPAAADDGHGARQMDQENLKTAAGIAAT